MRDGFRILDVDRHVMEPISLWPEYLPAQMRAYAPQLTPFGPPETLAERMNRLGEHALLPTPPILSVAGEPLMRVPEVAYIELGLVATRRREVLAAAETPRGHLAEMDATGVDVAVVLPTYASCLVNDDGIDAERSRAYAHAYNRWMRDFCSTAPKRLLGPALLSRHDPVAMVIDLEEAVRDGVRAVVLRPNPVQGRTLSAPVHARFWAACEHHEVTVLLHEGTHARVSTAGTDRFETRFGQHACSHPMEAMMALLSLLEGGVLEAHPTLRVGLLEAGCGFLPYWLWRLDHVEYAQMRGEVRHRVRRPPSEYFQRQCWIALEPSEAMLDRVVTEIGASRMVFGTDFPHLDHGPGMVSDMMAQRAALGEEALRMILWESPCGLMGMDSRA
ncbi:amidohydrolase family protein [Polyangium sp. 6x1]|uniref:amidohydrolase family protein n=1 Tax=Polyangium sp. 6x1 TaxID=3042689 RepID=UPI0024825293|nr:amidohydrolase family protein [Polyangium sp. 6x1]MDI1443049.1 amidohydrolase family protein [Polyangium sp. 6x1]